MNLTQSLQAFSNFNVDRATASLWVFKKRPASENMNPFTAVSVMMADTLVHELKTLVLSYQSSHTTADEYNLLNQTSEGGFLAISREKTLFPSLQKLVDQYSQDFLVRNVKQLNNAAGYIFRLSDGNSVVYCAKKTASDWATRKQRGMMNIVFKEKTLEIMDSPSFSITRSFDFFAEGDTVFIVNKSAFESLLNHKETYEDAYNELKMEKGFAAAIADFKVFDDFIGKNATHLRRMAVIKARGYYENPDYMARLRSINELRQWGIQFDGNGRIMPTLEKMRDILHVLLDHRLRSELSENEYDVPSTTPVG
jgi:hypothetical protein